MIFLFSWTGKNNNLSLNQKRHGRNKYYPKQGKIIIAYGN